MSTDEAQAHEGRSDYRADWGLFTDWCTVTGHTPLPATVDTLLAFLQDCPVAPATFARRLTAIDHAHRHAGLPPPARTDPIRDAVRGRPAQPARVELTDHQLEAALHRLPTHGWTNGWFGRRDRALLVLAHTGLPYRQIAALTAGDVTLTKGVAAVHTPTGTIGLSPDDGDVVVCGPCAVARWLRGLRIAATRSSTRILADAIERAEPLTDQSPHLCRSRRPLTTDIEHLPLLPPIDPRGHLALEPTPLTPHSLSRLARDAGSGHTTIHWVMPQTVETETVRERPVPAPSAAYSTTDWEQATARRRQDREHLRELSQTLDDIDRRAAQLLTRTVELLAEQ